MGARAVPGPRVRRRTWRGGLELGKSNAILEPLVAAMHRTVIGVHVPRSLTFSVLFPGSVQATPLLICRMNARSLSVDIGGQRIEGV